jgi:ribosomal protein S18 acetylase RimI-like enzyme
MKRLFVVPDGRGLGLGKAMVLASIVAAEDIGYREIRLDTLPTMGAAQALYRALQFESIAPYYPSPIADTLFMRRALALSARG